jgi:hypothetical protein
MFFEIQSAKLEADDRAIEVAVPPPRNLSRRNSNTIIVGNSHSVLDQIKRSAGNTPAFKASERRSVNTVNHHTQIYDYDDIPTNHGDEDLTSLYDAYEIDLLRQNDTDKGFAGFGVTPFATSSKHSDFKLESNFSLKTATTADESSYSLQNHTTEFTSFFFDHDAIDDSNDMDNDHAPAESDKKSHVSTNSSRTMNYFTSMHNNTKMQEQQQPIPPPSSSVASSSTKRFSPFKNIIGPAERMLRLLDGPTVSQQQNQKKQPTPLIHQQSEVESPSHEDEQQQSQLWHRDNDSNDEATDEDEEIPFGEPVSLLDVEDNDDDEDYGDEQEGDDDQTYSDSYTQAYTNTIYDDDDDVSYYDTDDYDDDETLLTMDDDDDGYYDEHDENSSKLPPESMMVTGVESFLDELAEVEDVRDLGTLLYQVGSCNFQGIVHTTAKKSTGNNNNNNNNKDEYDDEYTVTSDAFPTMKQDISTIHTLHSNSTIQQQQQELPQPHATPFTLWPQKPHDPSTTKQSLPRLPVDQRGSQSRTDKTNHHHSGQRFMEGTTDTVAHILHSMSISTESLYDIMGTSSNLSQPSVASSFLKDPTEKMNSNMATTTTAETPNNANQSFFQSIFSCHG